MSRIAKKSAPPIMPSNAIINSRIAGINENIKKNTLLYPPYAILSIIASKLAGTHVSSGMSLSFISRYEAYASVNSVAQAIIE